MILLFDTMIIGYEIDNYIYMSWNFPQLSDSQPHGIIKSISINICINM